MNPPLVLLVEASDGRRAEIARAIEEAHFRCLAVADPSAAFASALVSPDIVAVSLLGGKASPHPLLRAWHEVPGRASIPLLGIVPAGSGAEAETALGNGADDVLEWPAGVLRLGARLRSLSGRSLLRRESSDFKRALGSILRGFEAREVHRVDHSLRVSGLVSELGRLAALSPEELDRLRQGSVFYDIGTVAIPDRILLKEAEFSAEELALVRSHPVVGFEMIRGIGSLEPLVPFVLRHHERIDGSGYPYGLKGRDVPLAVQVLGMSDSYEALVSSRPHRPPRRHGEAMTILGDESRRGHWDRSLLDLLEEAVPASDVHGEVARD